MKKKKVVKRKVSNKISYDKKFVALAIAAFFVFAIALNYANVPQNSTAVTGHATSSFVSDFFTSWSEGSLDLNVAKYLFWIIITFIIFSALNIAKIPSQTALQWLIAIPISFLATAYLAPSEVFAVLTTYSALGLTLAVIVPFIVMILISAMLLSNTKVQQMTVGKIMFEVMLWLFFAGFLIYKLIAGYQNIDRSNGVLITIWVVLGLSVAILTFNKQFRNWVRGIGNEIKKAQAEAGKLERDIEEEFGD
ncbi:MAG: hypothetical protein Q8P15_01890 [Nanoarchaeota archaeon]|nr:hypothetical protein [Nanoarchaeota archaeon]